MNDLKIKKQFKRKKIATYISLFIASYAFTNATLSALPSDLNIYKQPTQGQSTILLMLDSTANMDDNYDGKPRKASGNTPIGAILADYPECEGQDLKHVPFNVLDIVYGKQATNSVSATLANSTFPPYAGIPYCGDSLSTTEKAYTILTITNQQKAALVQKVKGFKYSRMDRMKIAMSLLLSDNSIDDKVSLGLGQFSTATPNSYHLYPNQAPGTWINNGYVSKWTVDNDSNNSHKDGNDISAKILISNKKLDNDQRFVMRAAVGVMGSGGRTPLASALAESGAYMLGNTTLNADKTSPGTSIPRFWYGGWKGIYTGIYLPGVSYYGPGSSGYSSNVTRGYEYSGFRDSAESAKSGDRYASPIPTSTASCNASGIFLLSNGIPTETPRATAQDLMKNALSDSTFTCPDNNVGGRISATGTTDYGWTCMGAFSKRLFNNTPQVKVAVAGFGNNFIPYLTSGMSKEVMGTDRKLRRYYKCNALKTGTYNYNGQSFNVTSSNLQDIKNSCNLGELSVSDTDINTDGTVGGYGQGGFYPIVEASQLADSIKNFVAELQTGIPSLNSGLPGIPVDPLNSSQQLPFAYYSQFQPNTTSSQAKGIWLGNIKKYKVTDNTFQDKNSNNVVDSTTGNLNSTNDFWSNGQDGGDATKGGVFAKLPVQTTSGRKIYTNRSVSGTTESEITTADTTLNLIDSKKNTTDATGTAEALRASTDVNQTNAYLLNLLGFGVSTPTVPASLDNAAALRQMGATINSTPLMFTTESKIAVKSTTVTKDGVTTTYNPGDYIDRKDYVLFGTNQGLLQVVNANTGTEEFVFLPNEMIQKQKKGFVSKSLQTGEDYPELYSGVDGAWSVYASYVAGDDSNSLEAEHLNVYGGLRRGGSNYYGLDLKDIETAAPKLLFKVGPTEGGTCSNSAPLNCMGQSWSKPVTAWVKWKGKPQLVMIVGGGYDPVFDAPTYKANTNVTKGNGVYMFAANSNSDTGLTAGDLMWWGSSTATATTAGANNTTQKTNNQNLKYSVVSEIKTIDRDGDGFVDNLYFGDLGGQLFRVDINNAASTATSNFNVKRIVRIGNFIADNVRSTKAAPRFYYMPTFTTHRINNMGGIKKATRYAVISIGSGDQSSPIYNQLTQSTGEPDRIYGVFDRDLGRTDLYTLSSDTAENDGLLTGTANITNMLDIAITTGDNAASLANMRKATTKGWFNTLSGTTLGNATNLDADAKDGVARYKVLTHFSVINHTMFTSYFDAADNGSSSSCSAGVKGRSFKKNYCLPFGNMNAEGTNCGKPNDGRGFSGATVIGSDVGAGIVPVIVGGMTSTTGMTIGPITGKGPGSGVTAQFGMPIRFEPLKWAEKNS